MSPRPAGILAMVAALGLAIFGGALFHYGWAGVLGAIVIVAASILFAIGSLWTLRKSWADKTWPPELSVDMAKVMRRRRSRAVVSCGIGVFLIGTSIALIVLDGSFWPYAIGLVLGGLNLANGIVVLRELNHPRKNDFWTT